MKTIKAFLIALFIIPVLFLNAGYNNYLIPKFLPPPPCGLPVNITRDLVTDFGAVGDGITDDSQAFLNATDWINANWSASYSIKLTIPAGNFLVGKQLRRGQTWNYGSGSITNPVGGINYLGIDMLHLVGVKNVVIEGATGLTSKIIYKDKLAFGGLNATTGAPCISASGCNTCPSGDIATVGIFLNIDKCYCVTVSNLWIEGHANSCILGGGVGECGSRQLAYDGIVIWGGSNITIKNTVAANFGRDGLMTLYKTGDPTNITLDNFVSSGNARQGFSFTSGYNIVATDCRFDLSGPSNSGCAFTSNPQSGLDIEPESGGTCKSSSFTRCRFENNYNFGMVSDNHYPDVSDITFDGCSFIGRNNAGGSGYAIWPMRMINTKFTNSTIVGQILHVAGTSPTDHMLFQLCNFSDFFISTDWPTSSWNRYMLDLGSSPPDDIYFTFDQCNFSINHSLLVYADPTGTSHADRLFNKNNFELNFTNTYATGGGFPATTTGQSMGHVDNCTLNSNTFIDRWPDLPKPPGYWLGVAQPGSTSAANTTDGQNKFLPAGRYFYSHFGYNINWAASNARSFGTW